MKKFLCMFVMWCNVLPVCSMQEDAVQPEEPTLPAKISLKEQYFKLTQEGESTSEILSAIVAKILFERSSINWYFLNDCIYQIKAVKNK